MRDVGNGGPGSADAGRDAPADRPALQAPVVLAREAGFVLGPLSVEPATRQLAWPVGQSETLEPRVMQVLVALHRARGAVLTRYDLTAACWHGMVVGEDSIQRAIQRLRKVAERADGAFRIETITRVGYRLLADATVDAPAEPGPDHDDPRKSATATPRASAPPVLAVLPFDNLSSDSELAFFCDGVSEEILTRITRHSALTLIGRTSSFQFRGADKARAAASLNASHVLDGSIQRAGGRIRVSAHLLDCATQTSLWSERYDRNLEDIFAVQDEISEAIADALKVEFAASEVAAVDPAIYDLYLRAKERVTSPARMQRNLASLEQVVHRACGFAAGWATLAYRRAEWMMHCPYGDRAAMRAAIERDIARSEELDPGHPDALAARWVLMPPFGSHAAQEAMLNSNAVINRDFVDFLTARAYFLECAGRSREAVDQAARAAALDPLNPFAAGLHAQALWFAGRYDEARAALERVRERWPDSHHSVAVLIQACVHQQDWAAVERLTDPARLALYPLREHVGVVAFARVMRDPSPRGRRAMFETIRKRADATGHIDPQVAVVAAELGFVDETYALLERSRFGPCGSPRDVMGTHAYRTLLLFPQAYRTLRADPRFVTVCARLGLVDYWLTTQHWPDCAADVPYDFRAECERHRGHPRDPFMALATPAGRG